MQDFVHQPYDIAISNKTCTGDLAVTASSACVGKLLTYATCWGLSGLVSGLEETSFCRGALFHQVFDPGVFALILRSTLLSKYRVKGIFCHPLFRATAGTQPSFPCINHLMGLVCSPSPGRDGPLKRQGWEALRSKICLDSVCSKYKPQVWHWMVSWSLDW